MGVEVLIEKLKSLLGTRGFSLLVEGLRDSVMLGGDVSRLYHRVASLYPDYSGYFSVGGGYYGEYYKEYPGRERIRLPRPVRSSGVDVLEAIRSRRSRRTYSRRPLKLADLSALLYYTVGVTGRAWWGGPKRAYPSAGALQPVEVYVSASRVEDLGEGLYHYNPGLHGLELLRPGDYSRELEEAALGQEHVGRAPVVLILTAVYSRTASRYGQRSYRYIHWDAGFAGENIYLVSEALGMATVAVGAFYDYEVCRILEIDCTWEMPMLLFPVGYRVH
ncbi:MAG: SagB/ThcOx family dehydrogenase [Desulfurococcales archaeon]|nr:SagB/ThcOx family dehydrogenase [Desulfurococcales archaeon]